MMRPRRDFTRFVVGFTLIELLIVIAVVGVLAGAIFVIINPSERLAQARDATRKADVRNLYHAIEDWNISTQLTAGDTSYNLRPAEGNLWQLDLLEAGVIKATKTAPPNSRGACTYNASSTNHLGYCMSNNGAPVGEIQVWTLIESRAETVKAGGVCATDPVTNYAVVTSSSNRGGRTGLVCIGPDTSTAPPWAAPMY